MLYQNKNKCMPIVRVSQGRENCQLKVSPILKHSLQKKGMIVCNRYVLYVRIDRIIWKPLSIVKLRLSNGRSFWYTRSELVHSESQKKSYCYIGTERHSQSCNAPLNSIPKTIWWIERICDILRKQENISDEKTDVSWLAFWSKNVVVREMQKFFSSLHGTRIAL